MIGRALEERLAHGLHGHTNLLGDDWHATLYLDLACTGRTGPGNGNRLCAGVEGRDELLRGKPTAADHRPRWKGRGHGSVFVRMPRVQRVSRHHEAVEEQPARECAGRLPARGLQAGRGLADVPTCVL